MFVFEASCLETGGLDLQVEDSESALVDVSRAEGSAEAEQCCISLVQNLKRHE